MDNVPIDDGREEQLIAKDAELTQFVIEKIMHGKIATDGHGKIVGYMGRRKVFHSFDPIYRVDDAFRLLEGAKYWTIDGGKDCASQKGGCCSCDVIFAWDTISGFADTTSRAITLAAAKSHGWEE